MPESKPQKRTVDKKNLLLFSAAIALYLVCIGAIFAFDAFYNDIYDTPRVEHGRADYSGANWSDRLTAHSLAGEWEFFYGKWIITDGCDGECDGYISVPDRWTGKNFGGKKLSRFGYASYRITLENIEADRLLTAFIDNAVTPVRVFLNGRQCAVSGVVSKDPDKAESGRSQKTDHIISDGGDVTVVIETGYTSSGGLSCAPYLDFTMTSPAYWAFLERFAAVFVFGLAIGAFVMTLIITLAFRRYGADITLPLLIFMLCLHFLFSKDITVGIGLYGYGKVWIPAIVTGILTVAVFALHILGLSGETKLRNILPTAVILGLSVISYGVLYGTRYTAIPALIFICSALFPLYPFCKSPKVDAKFKAAYTFIYTLTLFALSMEVIDGTGACKFGTEYFFAIAMTAIIVAQCAASFLRLYSFSRRLSRINELEHEVERARLRALSAQIKPHFVFNSLNAIRAQYHKNVDEGDAALNNFASLLRSAIGAGKSENLITFDAEVRNILNYFDLENLRADGALTLLLDIDERNFKVPELSLQPFVENAVKYADTQSVKDGYIKLSSVRDGDRAVVTIEDNGKGFDTARPRNGVGIDNSRTRLLGQAGAEVKIESRQGEGTKITVIVPIDGGQCEADNS